MASHHNWSTVSETFANPDPRLERYLVIHSFVDNIAGQINADRMVDAVRSVFGPTGAYRISSGQSPDCIHHVAVFPEDVVLAQARYLNELLRDQGGWIDRADYEERMLPIIDAYWRTMPTDARIELADFNDVRADAVLEARCPYELQAEVQCRADP